MKIVNVADVPIEQSSSPTGKFASSDQEISIALGRQPTSTDAKLRHPFDIEICRIPPGAAACPYHSHSAQWEFYHVLSGTGKVRHANGSSAIRADDCFIFGPDEPHQLINDGSETLVVYIVADNPSGESCYYPDSDKWMVRSPARRLIRSPALEYWDGEE